MSDSKRTRLSSLCLVSVLEDFRVSIITFVPVFEEWLYSFSFVGNMTPRSLLFITMSDFLDFIFIYQLWIFASRKSGLSSRNTLRAGGEIHQIKVSGIGIEAADMFFWNPSNVSHLRLAWWIIVLNYTGVNI